MFCEQSVTDNQFQAPFVFHNFVHNRRMGAKKKMKLNFSRIFDNRSIPFSKEFLACIGTSFWCIFSAYFFHENVPSLTLYQLIKFHYQTQFPSRDIKQYVFQILVQSIDDVINFQIYLQSSFQAIADIRKKEGKREIQKFEYLGSKKSFFDEIKSIFHNFLRAIIW